MPRHITSFDLAGHTFQLKNLQNGIHSQETPDYKAELFVDGHFVCYCENFGHGEDTDCRTDPNRKDSLPVSTIKSVAQEIAGITMFKLSSGRKIPWSMGDIADHIVLLSKMKPVASKKRPGKGGKKFAVGVYLPISYYTEVFAKDEEEAKQAALDEALQAPLSDWDDDFSKATAEVFDDPNFPGLK